MKDWMEKKYGPLIGAKVLSIEPFPEEPEYLRILVQLKDGTKRVLVPQRDPEGNGPGFLEVSDVIETEE